jgi:hypothetical protein
MHTSIHTHTQIVEPVALNFAKQGQEVLVHVVAKDCAHVDLQILQNHK